MLLIIFSHKIQQHQFHHLTFHDVVGACSACVRVCSGKPANPPQKCNASAANNQPSQANKPKAK